MRHEHGGKTSAGLFEPDEVLPKLIKPDDIVLDAGASSGFLSIPAVRLSKKVYAIDCHPDSIQGLMKRSDLTAMEADIVKGFELPEKVDLIILSNVLHGFVMNGETNAALGNLLAHLSEGGRIAVIEFMKKETPHGPPFEHRLEPEKLDGIMSAHGMRRTDYFSAGDSCYTAVYQKN